MENKINNPQAKVENKSRDGFLKYLVGIFIGMGIVYLNHPYGTIFALIIGIILGILFYIKKEKI